MNEKLVEKVAQLIANEYPNQIKYTLSPRELAYKIIPLISQEVREEIEFIDKPSPKPLSPTTSRKGSCIGE